jgi:hypothetical protein
MNMTGFKLNVIILISGILLTACNYSITPSQPLDPGQLETMTAATVSFKLTQISVETLIAEATRLSMHTATPTVTNTPTATFTPVFTATPVTPTATPIPPTNTPNPIPCNQASYITDVTVPDNTTFVAGQSFIKTWRIKNTGSCNWTTAYSLFFVNGNAFSAPASVPLTKTVKPGETIDVSVSMVAPSATGNFTSNWMITAPNASVFGVGNTPGVPLTTVIKVISIPAPLDSFTVYDFVGNYCSAQWRTNAGNITCPTSGIDFKNGTISRTYAPILESGTVDDEGALITIPSYGGDGFIRGQFPQILIHSGDRFQATLLCTANTPKCSVTFEVLYMISGTNTVTSLGTWDKVNDNSFVPVNIDLSALDGKNVIFYLKVSSKSDPTDDFAQWMAARITHP